MPSITLKVTRPSAAVTDHPAPELGKPAFCGTGDPDYLWRSLRVHHRCKHGIDATTCSACGAENEFPPRLRA